MARTSNQARWPTLSRVPRVTRFTKLPWLTGLVARLIPPRAAEVVSGTGQWCGSRLTVSPRRVFADAFPKVLQARRQPRSACRVAGWGS